MPPLVQIVKDSYHFDFLTLGNDAQERELEYALVDHIRDFLLELGLGFAFLGNQYPIEVSGKEYRLDLLFYHISLRCFVVIELLCDRSHNNSTTIKHRRRRWKNNRSTRNH